MVTIIETSTMFSHLLINVLELKKQRTFRLYMNVRCSYMLLT